MILLTKIVNITELPSGNLSSVSEVGKIARLLLGINFL